MSASTPTPTRIQILNTPTPTQITAHTVTVAVSNLPTKTPTKFITATPIPTKVQSLVITPTKPQTVVNTPTKTLSIINTPTNTPIPVAIVQTSEGRTGIGKFGGGNQLAQNSMPEENNEPPLTPVIEQQSIQDQSNGDMSQQIILWSEMLVLASFLLLIVTIVVGVYKRLRTHI